MPLQRCRIVVKSAAGPSGTYSGEDPSLLLGSSADPRTGHQAPKFCGASGITMMPDLRSTCSEPGVSPPQGSRGSERSNTEAGFPQLRVAEPGQTPGLLDPRVLSAALPIPEGCSHNPSPPLPRGSLSSSLWNHLNGVLLNAPEKNVCTVLSLPVLALATLAPGKVVGLRSEISHLVCSW